MVGFCNLVGTGITPVSKKLKCAAAIPDVGKRIKFMESPYSESSKKAQ